jgi:hypothetical protein
MKKVRVLLISVLFGLYFVMSALAPTIATAGPEEEALLGQISFRANERWENVFYEFSDLALKKFCPAQFDEIQRILQIGRPAGQPVSLADVRDERDDLLEMVLHRCSDAALVLGLEYRFNEYLALLTADLLVRVNVLLSNPNIDLVFEERKVLADLIVDVALDQDYHAAKVLDILTSPGRSISEIRMEYLTHPAGGAGAEAVLLEGAAVGGGGASSGDGAVAEQAPKPAKKSRCRVCNVKLGLTPFVCKCEGEFCGQHRPPEVHACTFDYKAEGKAVLTKAMPVVNGDKLPDRI